MNTLIGIEKVLAQLGFTKIQTCEYKAGPILCRIQVNQMTTFNHVFFVVPRQVEKKIIFDTFEFVVDYKYNTIFKYLYNEKCCCDNTTNCMCKICLNDDHFKSDKKTIFNVFCNIKNHITI